MKIINNNNDFIEAMKQSISKVYFPTGLILKFDNPILIVNNKKNIIKNKYQFSYKKRDLK